MGSLINLSRIFRMGAIACTKKDLLTKQISITKNFWNSQLRTYRKLKGVPRSLPWFQSLPEYQSEVSDPTEEEEKLATEVCAEINKQIIEDKTGRLFAIIHTAGKQYKITESDIIVIRGYWPPNPGDQIRFEKVLLLGCKDFTLVGRPLLQKDLVSVDATVLDKTFSPTVTHFRFRKRKQYRRIHFYRIQQTMVRINTITLNRNIDQKLEVEGLDQIF